MKPVTQYLRHPRYAIDAITRCLAPVMPDKLYLSILYRCRMGRWINWTNPLTFTEKIQWLKLYDRHPEYTLMVDKYAVKDYVSKIIGHQYVIPTLGVWGNVDSIDFDSLPEKFVLKTTHGGGSGGVVICFDKLKFDIKEAKSKLKNSVNSDIYKYKREWPYKNVPCRIIAEQYLEMPNNRDLTDYKIFCFNGNPKFIQVIQDRNTKETIDFFDTEWNHQEFVGLNPNVEKAKECPLKPENLNEMLQIARKLSKNRKFLRVDLYSFKSRIYFGELTFYPASGYGKFTPIEWDEKMGSLLKLQ